MASGAAVWFAHWKPLRLLLLLIFSLPPFVLPLPGVCLCLSSPCSVCVCARARRRRCRLPPSLPPFLLSASHLHLLQSSANTHLDQAPSSSSSFWAYLLFFLCVRVCVRCRGDGTLARRHFWAVEDGGWDARGRLTGLSQLSVPSVSRNSRRRCRRRIGLFFFFFFPPSLSQPLLSSSSPILPLAPLWECGRGEPLVKVSTDSSRRERSYLQRRAAGCRRSDGQPAAHPSTPPPDAAVTPGKQKCNLQISWMSTSIVVFRLHLLSGLFPKNDNKRGNWGAGGGMQS